MTIVTTDSDKDRHLKMAARRLDAAMSSFADAAIADELTGDLAWALMMLLERALLDLRCAGVDSP